MNDADVFAVADLNEQMGYSTTAAGMQGRYEMLACRPDNGLFVAKRDGIVIGWVHVLGVHFLASANSFAQIVGLVVDENVRRQKVGQALVEQAETWAREHGYPEVRLRSGLHRTDAHQFYQAVGYTLTKTAHMFQKTLDAPSSPGITHCDQTEDEHDAA